MYQNIQKGVDQEHVASYTIRARRVQNVKYKSKEAYERAKKYTREYGETHFRRYQLRLRYVEDEELIDYLSQIYNMNRYIAELIEADLKKQKAIATKQGISLKELLRKQYLKDAERYGKLQGK